MGVMAAITSKLEGSIREHLQKIADMQSQTMVYFNNESKLWRAIVEHISEAKECVLFERDKFPVAMHNNYGPAVYFRSCRSQHQYSFVINLTVFFHDEENVSGIKLNDVDEFQRQVQIEIPFDLELDFTFVKFSKWIASKKKAKKAESAQQQLKTLANFLSKKKRTTSFEKMLK